jgi:hypothetical protein
LGIDVDGSKRDQSSVNNQARGLPAKQKGIGRKSRAGSRASNRRWSTSSSALPHFLSSTIQKAVSLYREKVYLQPVAQQSVYPICAVAF